MREEIAKLSDRMLVYKLKNEIGGKTELKEIVDELYKRAAAESNYGLWEIAQRFDRNLCR